MGSSFECPSDGDTPELSDVREPVENQSLEMGLVWSQMCLKVLVS